MEDFVTCPICNKEFKTVSFTHIKTHGFKNMEVFLKHVEDNGLKYELQSESMMAKRSKTLIGIKRPNHSKLMSGKNNPMYGRKRTDEEKELISKNRKGKGIGVSGLYIRTDEIKEKTSEGVTKAYLNGRLNSKKRGISGYYKIKTGAMVFYRSSWEKLVMQYLDSHPLVTHWSYENLHIPYVDENGKNRAYIPDFCVTISDCMNEIWEVKPDKDKDERYECKIDALKKFIKENGYSGYNIVSDDQLKIIKNIDYDKIRKDYHMEGE
jgi:hypothetical protein